MVFGLVWGLRIDDDDRPRGTHDGLEPDSSGGGLVLYRRGLPISVPCGTLAVASGQCPGLPRGLWFGGLVRSVSEFGQSVRESG
jgi:hypothetical protein